MDRFITETLALIAEKGSSKDANLREISRRVGCAHTNAYNYFNDMEDLTWAAYKNALLLYAESIEDGLSDELSEYDYFDRLIRNMIGFAMNNPGIYRFIASDPLSPEAIPVKIMDIITKMKLFYLRAIRVLCKGTLTTKKADKIGDIILAYLDGEIFNTINGRYLPSEDIPGRVVGNVHDLFTLLTAKTNDGIILKKTASVAGNGPFPKLDIPSLFEGGHR